MVALDKNNPTPLYYQLQQIIKEGIESGQWRLGDTIPTENEMIEQYGISRSTVRQAVLMLVNEGYLKREKSKGTIVTSQTGRTRFIGGLISFTEEMNRKNILHSSHILDKQLIPADVEIAEKLRLKAGETVYYLKRIRYVNEHPFLVDEHFIPYALCPGIETKYTENTSLYKLLHDQYHLNLHHGQIEFEAVSAPSREMVSLLGVSAKTSLLQAERTVYSEKEVPLDYFKAITCGKFSVDVLTT